MPIPRAPVKIFWALYAELSRRDEFSTEDERQASLEHLPWLKLLIMQRGVRLAQRKKSRESLRFESTEKITDAYPLREVYASLV